MIHEPDLKVNSQPENLINKQKKKDQKKRRHVLLTDRDLAMLVALHDHVVLSFAQIHERFFTNRTMATAMNRLKRLESEGLIVRIRIQRMRVQGRENVTGVVFQLSNKGRTVVAKEFPEVEFFEKCPLVNPNQLDHDILIADIAGYFFGRFPAYKWTNGRYLLDIDGFGKIPDAVLRNTFSGKAIAIELELNAKSLRRYKEIATNLKSSRAIEKVIFVTSSTAIGRKIMSAIEGHSVQVGHSLRSDFFEFVRLAECLKVKNILPQSDSPKRRATLETLKPSQMKDQTKGQK